MYTKHSACLHYYLFAGGWRISTEWRHYLEPALADLNETCSGLVE